MTITYENRPGTIPGIPLRDLTNEEFIERYGADRFTTSLLNTKSTYAVQHMATAFRRQAFSPIVSLVYDFSCVIVGPRDVDYAMGAISDGLPTFIGAMTEAVRNTVEEYGYEKLREGDVIIGNDPYRIGGHVNDLCFVKPIFYEGKIVSFVAMKVHQLDFGGVTPGGFSPTKRNTYEDGLVLGPMLMWSEGQPVRHAFSLLFDNTRWGSLILPDLFATERQLGFGERMITEIVERYGLEPYLGSIRYAVDASAETMANAIAELPDGDYTGTSYIDADGIDDTETYEIHVTLRVRGSMIEADLSGTSRQARTGINCTFIEAKNAVGCALSMLLAPGIAFTSGNWRNIDVVCPPGSLVSAMPPDGPVTMYFYAAHSVLSAVTNALANVLGPRAVGGDLGRNVHNAVGTRPDGSQWSTVGAFGGEQGPWGASQAGDGENCIISILANISSQGFEPIEASVPVVALSNEAVIDSGGPGYHRGGSAMSRDSLWLTDSTHFPAPVTLKTASGFGVHGGRDGAIGAAWTFAPEVAAVAERQQLVSHTAETLASSEPVAGVLNPTTKLQDLEGGEYFYFGRRQTWDLPAGSVLRSMTNGGGGWGDPFTREVERVLSDVRNSYVSIAGAARDYGVVVLGDPDTDPEGLTVDIDTTAKLRNARTDDL